jgi:hypothetical protein
VRLGSFSKLKAGTRGSGDDERQQQPEGSLGSRIIRFVKWILRVHFKIDLNGNTTATSEILIGENVTLSDVDKRALDTPEGPRWAISANKTNLTGRWKPIVTPEFKQEYDEYLKNCSQSVFFRKLVLSTIGLTEGEIQQNGRNLTITDRNPAGAWTRTLVSSGADLNTTDYEPVQVEIKDPDADLVQVEAWWEQQGKVHRSILRGKPRIKGGSFETLRYLESDNVLVTDSIFHPPPDSNGSFRPGFVKWRYQRMS